MSTVSRTSRIPSTLGTLRKLPRVADAPPVRDTDPDPHDRRQDYHPDRQQDDQQPSDRLGQHVDKLV